MSLDIHAHLMLLIDAIDDELARRAKARLTKDPKPRPAAAPSGCGRPEARPAVASVAVPLPEAAEIPAGPPAEPAEEAPPAVTAAGNGEGPAGNQPARPEAGRQPARVAGRAASPTIAERLHALPYDGAWTRAEDLQLMRRAAKGVAFPAICAALEREPREVRARINLLTDSERHDRRQVLAALEAVADSDARAEMEARP